MQSLDLRPPRAGGPRVPMVVVLLSDGNNTSGEVSPVDAATAAQEAGVRVNTISVGRRPGDPPAGSFPGRPSNHRTLRAIADRTRGSFYRAPSEADLETVLRGLGSSVATVRERREVTAAFVGAALVLLVAGGGLSALWFNRLV